MRHRYNHVVVDGIRKAEHRVIWEQAHGPIPPGYDIHHINFDGHDNSLSNLIMLTHADHMRLHASLKKNGQDTQNPEVLKHREIGRQRGRARYATHREEILENQAEAYKKNPELKRAKSKLYYEANKEKCLKSCKVYREKHRDEKVAYSREYWSKNRDELLAKKKLYNDAHKKERALKERIRQAIKHGKPQELIDQLRQELEKIKGGIPNRG